MMKIYMRFEELIFSILHNQLINLMVDVPLNVRANMNFQYDGGPV